MPAVSKAQFDYMQAVAHGKARMTDGPSKSQAKEFIKGQSPKGLPTKAKKKPSRKTK